MKSKARTKAVSAVVTAAATFGSVVAAAAPETQTTEPVTAGQRTDDDMLANRREIDTAIDDAARTIPGLAHDEAKRRALVSSLMTISNVRLTVKPRGYEGKEEWKSGYTGTVDGLSAKILSGSLPDAAHIDKEFRSRTVEAYSKNHSEFKKFYDEHLSKDPALAGTTFEEARAALLKSAIILHQTDPHQFEIAWRWTYINPFCDGTDPSQRAAPTTQDARP